MPAPGDSHADANFFLFFPTHPDNQWLEQFFMGTVLNEKIKQNGSTH